MCDCISYNGQVEGQSGTPEVVLDPRKYFDFCTKIVCVDACIADHIVALWEAGIWTGSCCCGHNNTFPRHVLVNNPEDGYRAKQILMERKAGLSVWAWMRVDF